MCEGYLEIVLHCLYTVLAHRVPRRGGGRTRRRAVVLEYGRVWMYSQNALQCVAVCCSMLQCVEVQCGVVRC